MMSAYIRPRVRLEEEEWSCKKISFKRKSCFNLHFRRKVGFKEKTNKQTQEREGFKRILLAEGFQKHFTRSTCAKTVVVVCTSLNFIDLIEGARDCLRLTRRFYRTKNLLATYGTRYYRFYFCNGCKHVSSRKAARTHF